MNSLIKLIISLIIATLSNFVKANENKSIHINLETELVLKKYIDLIQNGNYTDAEKLFSHNFVQTNRSKYGEKKFNKIKLLNHLKNIENLKFDCKTKYKILDSNKNITIAKIEMRFEQSVRIDYLTIYREDKMFQIQKIESNYL